MPQETISSVEMLWRRVLQKSRNYLGSSATNSLSWILLHSFMITWIPFSVGDQNMAR